MAKIPIILFTLAVVAFVCAAAQEGLFIFLPNELLLVTNFNLFNSQATVIQTHNNGAPVLPAVSRNARTSEESYVQPSKRYSANKNVFANQDFCVLPKTSVFQLQPRRVVAQHISFAYN